MVRPRADSVDRDANLKMIISENFKYMTFMLDYGWFRLPVFYGKFDRFHIKNHSSFIWFRLSYQKIIMGEIDGATAENT